MWRVLKFLLLVVICIPAWIAIQVALQTYAPRPVPSQGVRAVVDSKLAGERWRVVAMDPQVGADEWLLTGLVQVPLEAGAAKTTAKERVFLAGLRSTCQRYGDPKCWALESLAYADTDNFGADGGTPAAAADTAGRVKAVQTALKTLGFDPGPLDGAMGQQTRAAIAQYMQKASSTDDPLGAGSVAAVPPDPQSDRAMDELEAIGQVARGEAYQLENDYHGALRAYARAESLQPDMVQAHYNSGIIYRAMGLPDLAVDEYDLALAGKPDWELAFYQRASAYYQERHYLDAYRDYASGFGVRVLGAKYWALHDHLADLGNSARSGAVALSHWAEAAWQTTARLWRGTSGEDTSGQAADDPTKTEMAAEAEVDV